MKKISLINLFFILTVNIILAQENIIKNLDEVIVSANRSKTNNNITNIYIINQKDIENAPVQTIEDLLEYAINVDIRQRGGQGTGACALDPT